MTLESMFYPQSVAVIGSMSEGKIGRVILNQILQGQFGGLVYAVNPKGEGVINIPGYKNIRAVGEPIDLAVIASPAPTVSGILEECGRCDVPSAIIITAGFSEVGNSLGEDEIIQVTRQHKIRYIGPNCAGIVNTSNNLFATLETPPLKGKIGFISQSGALGGIVMAWAKEQGVGISKFVSYGNGSDLNQVALLDYLRDDEETAVVAVYVESVPDGRSFMDALGGCAAKKPVVVLKAGRTQAGVRATASHTGSMAGSDAVYEVAIKQSGAIRVNDVEELIDLCNGFSHTIPVRGRRVAIITNSGGPGVLAADQAEAKGLQVAEPSQATQIRFREYLPGHCSLKNPIDLTVEGTGPAYARTIQNLKNEYDAILAIDICPSFLDADAHAQGVVAAAKECDKPIFANFGPGEVVKEGVKTLKKQGIPNFLSAERAINAIGQIARYHERRALHGNNGEVKQWKRNPLMKKRALPAAGQMVEHQIMFWLKENGFPVPRFYFARTAEEALEGCLMIGFPVVMKVVSADILHKSDFGGVILDIRDQAAAMRAYDRLRMIASGKDFEGVVIYPQISGGLEVLLGVSCDPQFGPVVAFGLGGIYTEVFHDVALRVAPLSDAEAREMISDIRGYRILRGTRGQKPSDLDRLANLLQRVSFLPFEFPDIREMDLNPVFLFPDKILIGDARLIQWIQV